MPTTTKRRRYVITRVNDHFYSDGNKGPGFPQSIASVEDKTDSRTHDGPVHNWRVKIRNGDYAGTHLIGVRYKRSSKPFYAAWHMDSLIPIPIDGRWSSFYGMHGGIHLGFHTGGPLASVTEADNLAKIQFVRKIRAAQTSVQGGVFLGELRQTVQALRNPAKALREGIPNYFATLKKRKRGVRGTASQRARILKDTLANTWLEYAFGWKPLINDIDSASEALANAMVREDKAMRKRLDAWGEDQYSWFHNQANAVSNGPLQVRYTYSRHETLSIHYFGMLIVEHPYKIGAQRLGLDLSNWIPTAWELVPWSFLVDYFTNIGAMITAGTTLTSGLAWTMKTKRYSCSQEIRNMKVDPFAPSVPPTKSTGYTSLRPGKEVWEYSTVDRDRFLGSLVPTLQFNLPGFGTKWINMAALALGHNKLRPYY